jgi:hypothetical protein
MKKTAKRIRCAWCGRLRLAKFIEWHPGVVEWQCKDHDNCDAHHS